MIADLGALSAAAVSIGFVHTLFGPDHYVPFVAMSRAGGWSRRKTLLVTFLCGVAHVGSSVLLGFIGLALGLIVFQLETIETQRGNVAGWLLIGFGLAYLAWGLVRAIRNRPHSHLHARPDGAILEESEHPTTAKAAANRSLTPWILFVIFAFGPCEPLIPLLMYPAARADLLSAACVTALFGLTTLAVMASMVLLMCAGADALRFDRLERYSHALAGAVVLSCGVAIKAGL